MTTFAAGTTIGHYRILERIGAGGMGEVYLAEDTKLGREVALKVLPEAYVHDPERRMRLEREARLLASLNHPNVATLHGLQQFDDRAVLEMELVPGKTLADRLKESRLTMAEALPIFRQMAAGLEAAHSRGIIHRDLKPANIKVLPDGRVKLLDFGVGKVFDGSKDLDELTMTMGAKSASGAWVVGTAQYMSPEQARGHALDPRTDIWSFGCVMFETLTGRPPFKKETGFDTVAAILKDEPDWQLIADTAPPIQRLIRRCLQKDVQSRLRDIADARLEIEDALADTAVMRPAGEPRRTFAIRMPVAAGGVAAAILLIGAAAVGYVAGRSASPAGPRIRAAIPIPAGQRLAAGPGPVLAVSNDGRTLAYAAATGSRTQLFIRAFDRFDPTVVAGTEGASAPFFSPDGQWVGYHAGDALQRVSLAGGTPLRIADVPSMASASWGGDDTILYSTAAGDGVWKVAAGGGTPQRLTTPDGAKNETHHSFPQILPGGKTALFTVTVAGKAYPAVLTIASAQWKTLPQVVVGGGARYLSSGHLIYTQSGGLVAVPFDAEEGEVRGSPVPLLERVESPAFGAAQFAISGNGSLVYIPGQSARPTRSLVMADRDGQTVPLAGGRGAYQHPRLSPDGRQLAVTIEADSGSDIWILDLQRGTRTRLTSDGASAFPVWAPDGRSVTYHSSASSPWTLFARAADASSPARPLLSLARPDPTAPAMATLLPGTLPTLGGTNPQFPMSWSGDGRALAFTERKPSAERDIWVVEEGSNPTPFLVTPFDESAPAFSPDGKLLAYVSDESGRPEVYVQPYPGPGGRWLISTAGGTDPLWSADGRELLYRSGDDVMSVGMKTAPTVSAGTPVRVFEARYQESPTARNFDIAADGRRLVMVRGDESGAPMQFNVVFNWLTEIQRRGGN